MINLLLRRRNLQEDTSTKVFDYRVLYLGIDDTTGLSVIDTGYNPLNSTTFIIYSTFMLLGWVGSPSGYTPSIMTNLYSTNDLKATFWLRYNLDNSIAFYHSLNHRNGAGGKRINYNTVYTIIQEKNKVTINGSALSSFNTATVTNPSPSNLFLFGKTGASTYGKLRFYDFKVVDDEEVKVDLIPVVKNGKGYMFDKVSGSLCTNLGTRNFIIGPKISNNS